MTISNADVVLLKSQRLTDEDDGGGRATGVAVVDGEVNNLFPDISRLDRTLGRINLRKAFAGVVTNNADPYLGAHAIVTEAPGDARVSVVLFNTGSQTDERAEARSVIEGYVVPSTTAVFELLGDQFAGQRAITGIQRVESRAPEVGEVYQLVSGLNSQYVRCVSVEASLEDFVYDYGNGNYSTFTRRRLVISISSPLGVKYPGGQPIPSGTAAANFSGQAKSQVLATQVADAARYYGISPLAIACAAGDLTLQVQSVYAQLVPSAIKESALVNQVGGPRKRYVIASSATTRSLTLVFAQVAAGHSRAFLSTGAVRRSITLSAGGGTYTDNGAGLLTASGGSGGFSQITVDYETGEINAFRASTFTGNAPATFLPGTAATGQAVTGAVEIDLGNRGFAYTLNLVEAKPRPGTLSVSYQALGKWYELTDNGSGELVGEGSGSVDFATGAVSLSLDALPDVNTSLVYGYIGAQDDNFVIRQGNTPAPVIEIQHRLPHDGILPGSLVVSTAQGGAKTLTDNGSGLLSGDAGTGTIRYADGRVTLTLNATTDAGSSIGFAYQCGEAGTVVDTPLAAAPDAGGIISGTIPGAPLKPGTVQMKWQVQQKQKSAPVVNLNGQYESTVTLDREVSDDGAGNWPGRTGSLNYTTGAFSLDVEDPYDYPEFLIKYTFRESSSGIIKQTPHLITTQTQKQELFGGTLMVRAMPADATFEIETDSITAPALSWRILPAVQDSIVPGSLWLTWGAEQYIDRDGVLFKNVSTTTNAGIAVGSIDYASGLATLTTYPANLAGAVTRGACLTAKTGFSTTAAMFRTPGAPLRPGSVQITAVRADTAEIVTAVSDLNGIISSGIITGRVDAQTGIVQLNFTTNPLDITGASDVPVIASLLRYNAVLQTSLPMSADLLGLDPVRLPADGRVPIYRDGDVLVVHHTAVNSVPSPAAGGTLNLGRALQAEILVRDINGLALAPAQYSANRTAGQVTWANPLLLQAANGDPLSLPLEIHDRVEHMTVCTEVQITGAVSISSPMPWDLPEGAKVSSAVAWGDLQARLFRWFSQKSWNTGAPNWTDNPIGDSTTANYNQLNYPPVVTNRSAIGGKWAIVFTSSTAFQVVEEKLGVITTGTTSSDCAPINPATGTPYFAILAAGWGSGWAAANAVRFNTEPCLGPLWVVRTVLSGQGTVDDDQFQLQVRGDAD